LGRDRGEQFREASKELNRHQHCRLLLFRGDGTGSGVLWELTEEAYALQESDGSRS
jgi:hypothetical protein